ncbi:hypothetical protein MBLNU457_6956t1 [Dothideomycetes sp. NU457]
MAETYDFIIVGSGPAGTTLAARLANSPTPPSVLLIEAGAKDEDQTINKIMIANRFATWMTHPALNWGYKTVPQEHLAGRQIDYSRGKGVGGSSLINFSCWTLGPKDDYDEWARIVGDDSFDWKNIQRRFKALESFDVESCPDYIKYARALADNHGTHGPVHVELPAVWERHCSALADAAEEFGLDSNLDINSGNPIGMGIVPATSRGAKRWTCADGFLRDHPSSLTILPSTVASRILFDGKKAMGIEANGKQYFASKEVILSAGAIDTPKLLKLSGIGDSSELQKHNIELVLHSPAVGQNLQDHAMLNLLWVQNNHYDDRSLFNDEAYLKAATDQFAEKGTGPLASLNASQNMGFFKLPDLQSSAVFQALTKDEQAHLQRPTVPHYELLVGGPNPNPAMARDIPYLSAMVFMCHAKSRGTVKLASANINDPALCDPELLTDPYDKKVIIDAVRIAMQLVKTPSIANTIKEMTFGPASESDEDIWAFIRDTVMTSWHMSCTCAMGKEGDEKAVVDSNFRVFGLESLRVVDMSVTPFLPAAHTQACAYLIGATAAEKMIEEYGFDHMT